jgi:short-subunit dehydrogenase
MVPVFVERFKEKKIKGAIVVTASGFASRPIAGSITYSATKTFASFIAEGLNHELKDKIDFMSYQAGEVTTKMIYRYQTDARTISTDRAAQVCFRDLGLE